MKQLAVLPVSIAAIICWVIASMPAVAWSPPAQGGAGHTGPSADDPLTPLEKVHLALVDENPRLRGEAGNLLGVRGGIRSVVLLEALLKEKHFRVKFRALMGLSELFGRFDFFSSTHGEEFFEVLASIERQCVEIASSEYGLSLRSYALRQLDRHSVIGEETRATLFSIAQDRTHPLVLNAITRLALRGEDVGDLVAETIAVGGRGNYRPLLWSLGACEKRHIPEIRLLLESERAETRFRATAALERLEDPETDPEKPNLRALELEELASSITGKAYGKLQAAHWDNVEKEVVLSAARGARLVIFGEMHSREGPLRDGQIELLRAFFKDPDHDALGFEPSVERVQASVISAARALGMKVFPVEKNWKELRSQGRTYERDNETAGIINEYLCKDASNRLFVIRGESHVFPDGYLAREVYEQPMIVLSHHRPRLGSSSGGRGEELVQTQHVQMSDGQKVFVWPLPERFGGSYPALADWLGKGAERDG